MDQDTIVLQIILLKETVKILFLLVSTFQVFGKNRTVELFVSSAICLTLFSVDTVILKSL